MDSKEVTLSRTRTWLVAVRPFAYTASVLPVVLGASLALYAEYSIRWVPLAVTLLGVLAFHTGANLLNDAFDYRRGLDRRIHPGSGAVVRGWITEGQAMRVAMACIAIGVLCGLWLTVDSGWMVLLLGLLGGLCALGYTTPRFCFKYAGLGDVAIFLAFGPLTIFGTWWVQTQSFDWLPLVWSLPPALLTVGIVHANNWRDLEYDGASRCRTVAGMLGDAGSRGYYRVLLLGPFALVALYAGLGRAPSLNIPSPPTVMMAWLALPRAWRLARTQPHQGSETFSMLDAKTAQLHLLFGVLCATGFWIAAYIQIP